MKRLLLLLVVLACFSDAIAQDGWFRIHPATVRWYTAVTQDTLYALTDAGLERSDDGGTSWSFVATWPEGHVDESEYYRSDTYIPYVKFATRMNGMRTWMTKVTTKPLGEWSLSTLDEFTTNGGVTWYKGQLRPSSDLPDVALFFPPNTWSIMRQQGIYGPTVPAPEPQSALSTDGKNWLDRTLPSPRIQSGFAVRADRMFVDNFVTTDTGMTWQPLDHEVDHVITPNLLHSRWLDTSFFSTDEGITWTAKVDSVAIVMTNHAGLVYGRTGSQFNNTEKYWRSLDSGLTFDELPNFMAKTSMTLIDTSTLYALQDGELLKTKTGGRKLEVMSVTDRAAFTIYPNPASAKLTSNARLEWYDLLGRSYSPAYEESSNGLTYDVSTLSPGAYIVRDHQSSQLVYVTR